MNQIYTAEEVIRKVEELFKQGKDALVLGVHGSRSVYRVDDPGGVDEMKRSVRHHFAVPQVVAVADNNNNLNLTLQIDIKGERGFYPKLSIKNGRKYNVVVY